MSQLEIPAGKNLLLHRANGSGIPLFFIHADSGDTQVYAPLSSMLDVDIPMYGVQAPRQKVGLPPSVPDVAAYINSIRQKQPRGPYRVVGWGSAGSIVYEIAKQLLGEDERVEFVGMIDAYPYEHYPQSLGVPVWLFVATEPAIDRIQAWKNEAGDLLSIIDIRATHGATRDEARYSLLGRELSRALLQSTSAHSGDSIAAYSPIVGLRQGSAQDVPIFFVPGAGATVTSLIDTVRSLGPTVTAYGLQPRGLDGNHVPHASVRAAARANVTAIRRVYPAGPYRLVGHSFGGWVVAEMASQLERLGLPVAPVVLIDSDPPYRCGDEMPQTSRVAELMYLTEILELSCAKRFGLSPATLEQMTQEDQLRALWQAMVRHRLISSRTDVRLLRSIVRVFSANINSAFAPSAPLRGQFLLIRATDKLSERRLLLRRPLTDDEIVKRWLQAAPGMTIVTAAGNHMTMLAQPNAREIAEHLENLWNM